MEASALQAPAGVARSRISIGAPLLRLRSDEQLVALFRSGNDDAFRVIYDRYRQRLFAYTRQMLPGSRQDAEDALQDVFVRAYSGLRASDRDVALRAWLYRVAHNRCIDELRRPPLPAPELIELVRAPTQDPIAEAEQRESLRRLIADVRRLPEQQRSALLMRELSGMSYAELAVALGISVPAVKSLLVRARVGLAQAMEARDTSCTTIRDELIGSHDRRVRPNATARRHLRDCAACREFRGEMRGVSRQFAALVPAIGPMGVLANLLGIGGGGAAAGGGAAIAGGAAGTGGAFAAGGVVASGAAGHVAALLAAAVVTAGGAVEIQHSISTSPPAKHRAHHHVQAPVSPAVTSASTSQSTAVVPDTNSTGSASNAVAATPSAPVPVKPAAPAAAKQSPQGAKAPDQTIQISPSMPNSGGSALNDSNGTDPTGGVSGTGPTSTPLPGGGATPSGTTSPADGSSSSTPGTTSVTGTGTSATGAANTPAGGTSSSTAGSSTGLTSTSTTSSPGTGSSTSSTNVGSSGSVGLTH